MKYLEKSFSVAPGNNKNYRDNYEKVFAKETPIDLDHPCPECDCAIGDHGDFGCLGKDDQNPGCLKKCKRSY